MTPRLALCLLPLATMTLVGCNNTSATDEREPLAVDQPIGDEAADDRADTFELDANADPVAPPEDDVTIVDPFAMDFSREPAANPETNPETNPDAGVNATTRIVEAEPTPTIHPLDPNPEPGSASAAQPAVPAAAIPGAIQVPGAASASAQAPEWYLAQPQRQGDIIRASGQASGPALRTTRQRAVDAALANLAEFAGRRVDAPSVALARAVPTGSGFTVFVLVEATDAR